MRGRGRGRGSTRNDDAHAEIEAHVLHLANEVEGRREVARAVVMINHESKDITFTHRSLGEVARAVVEEALAEAEHFVRIAMRAVEALRLNKSLRQLEALLQVAHRRHRVVRCGAIRSVPLEELRCVLQRLQRLLVVAETVGR